MIKARLQRRFAVMRLARCVVYSISNVFMIMLQINY